jgi:uncharacterized protein (DUF2147 family)
VNIIRKILDPKSGKVYKCFITLQSEDKLKVRGYIGWEEPNIGIELNKLF